MSVVVTLSFAAAEEVKIRGEKSRRRIWSECALAVAVLQIFIWSSIKAFPHLLWLFEQLPYRKRVN